jgi:hypothetical protein
MRLDELANSLLFSDSLAPAKILPLEGSMMSPKALTTTSTEHSHGRPGFRFHARCSNSALHSLLDTEKFSHCGSGSGSDASLFNSIPPSVHAGLIAHLRIGAYPTISNPKIKDNGGWNNGYLGYANIESSPPFLQEFHHPTGGV